MKKHNVTQHLIGAAPDGISVAWAEDCVVYDTQGNSYIDFTSGWCVGNFGWSDEVIRTAIRDFDGPAYVRPGYTYAPWEEMARLLSALAPGGLDHCFRAASGTEAVEIALQAAMACTGRRRFAAVEGAYHGNSIAARALVADGGAAAPGCLRLSPPLDEGAIDRLEKLLAGRDVAAFIMEPVICNLGVLVPEAGFMQAAQRLCRRYGTLLVMDEVATGFGRTGRMFASEHFDIEPDIMCLAKAITGGYVPMGATLVTEAVARGAGDMEFYSTYGWHPLAVAAALANLEDVQYNKKALLDHVGRMGGLVADGLSGIDFGGAAGLRVKGLAIGVTLTGRDARDIQEKCREDGLLIDVVGENTLTLFPPLIVTRRLVHEGLDILRRCASGGRSPRRGEAAQRPAAHPAGP